MILEQLNHLDKITVITTQPLCIYTKCNNVESECWDNETNSQLDINNIDDSYNLNVIKDNERIDVFIPSNVTCILKKTNPNTDCTVIYKNIECDLLFEDEPIDNFFTIDY